MTSLVRLEPGARFPAHNHPAGEEVFVPSSEGGCVFLVTLPRPVEILED